jgi:tetratricopeptide (TPR) repeat protein
LPASPSSASAHFVKGQVLRAQNRCDEAIPEFEAARALDRNFVGALQDLGWCKLYAGSLDEVIPLVEQAIRLSPRSPGLGYRYLLIGTVHLLQSRTDEADQHAAFAAVIAFENFRELGLAISFGEFAKRSTTQRPFATPDGETPNATLHSVPECRHERAGGAGLSPGPRKPIPKAHKSLSRDTER